MLAAYQRTGSGSGSCKEKHDRDNGNDVGAVRGKSAVGFPSALLAFLSFEGCLSFGLASPPPGWSSGFVSRSFRPSNAVLRSVAALETRPFCSLLNVVLFHSERACS